MGISTLGYFYKIQSNHDVYNYHDEQERKITPDLSKLHRSLFWDTAMGKINWIRSANYIIQRVFEYGNETEIEEIIRFYGHKKVVEALDAIPATDTWKLNDRNRNRQLFGV